LGNTIPADSAQTPAARIPDLAKLGILCAQKFVARTHYRAPGGVGLDEDDIVHLFVADYEGR